MKLYCFDPKKQRNVLAGTLKVDGLKTYYFYKKVTKRHFMIKEHGYGIQEEILQRLLQEKVSRIIIKTKTSEIISDLEDWLKQPIKNYGHGNQRFLGGK
jgi:hypothetical protein